MNGTKYAPGQARPDLAALVMRHAWASAFAPGWDRPGVGVSGGYYVAAMLTETHPENFYATGTDLRTDQHPCQLDAAADDADRILRNHRRMAHRAWVRSMGDGDPDRANERAWLAARRYCGLPT